MRTRLKAQEPVRHQFSHDKSEEMGRREERGKGTLFVGKSLLKVTHLYLSTHCRQVIIGTSSLSSSIDFVTVYKPMPETDEIQ